MDIMEIILLIAGGIIFVLSFLIPEKRTAQEGFSDARMKDEVKNLVNQELEEVRSRMEEAVDEVITYAMEKTERSLERLSNEKIMAVNEYSDTVLAQIHKNHEETVFLYDMLNNKHGSLKNAVSEVNRAVKEAQDSVTALRGSVPESGEPEGRISEMSAPAAEAEKISGESATASGTTQTAASQAVSEETEQEPQQREPDVKGKILELYQNGATAVDIARKLGMGTGEVNLIIGLFKNRQK